MLAADSAAWGMGHAPSSEILWYANLEIFPGLHKSYNGLFYFVDLSYFQLYFIASPIFALASYELVAARMLRNRQESELPLRCLFSLLLGNGKPAPRGYLAWTGQPSFDESFFFGPRCLFGYHACLRVAVFIRDVPFSLYPQDTFALISCSPPIRKSFSS